MGPSTYGFRLWLGATIGTIVLGCAQARLMFREEGRVREAYVSEIELCQTQELPYFDLELSEIVPREIEQGGRANHRMTYVLCPENPTETISGTLTTEILHKGKPIELYNREEAYDLEEGRWTIDAFIDFPLDIPSGAYALQVVFSYEEGELRKVSPFTIEAK